ncbi:ATP synthase subunit d, mitochondrial-like [Paramacrobiotus metropolitanus]|uniref:ATP synthase subunit d, mitochondrial-like n=1 Tax=Paramacrobiotus metropolitanus TaxID=2943436 RepID=UPI002445772C|nr:ATP synthase subunit d, mitochondrial-like [Paramacrobiotus metropolitanus]
MAARRVTKSSIDWAAFNARIPPTQQAQAKAFKARHDAYLSKVMAHPESQPAIDWGYYASRIPNTQLVEEMKRSYEALKVPFPADTRTKEIDQQEQETIKAVQEFVKESEERVADHKQQLRRWEEIVPIHLMTEEEYVLSFPEHSFGLDQKRYQTMWPHNYNPRFGIPYEVGSGTWNIGPKSHLEKKFDINDNHH